MEMMWNYGGRGGLGRGLEGLEGIGGGLGMNSEHLFILLSVLVFLHCEFALSFICTL